MTLSKSQYIRGLQCHKSLWLYKNKPELRDTPDKAQESLFEKGYEVGEIAKELFPNGVEIDFDESNFNGMITKTKELIENGCEVIYEATFKDINLNRAFVVHINNQYVRKGDISPRALLSRVDITEIVKEQQENIVIKIETISNDCFIMFMILCKKHNGV